MKANPDPTSKKTSGKAGRAPAKKQKDAGNYVVLSDYIDAKSRPKKKKKVLLFVVLSAVLLVLGVAGYLYIKEADYYKHRFLRGTEVNGITADELTVSELEQELEGSVDDYSLHVTFKDQETHTISGSDIGYTYTSDGSAKQIKEEQNSYLWIASYLGRKQEYTAATNTTYDAEALRSKLLALPGMQQEQMTPPEDAKLEYIDGQFVVTPEVEGTEIDTEAVLAEAVRLADAREDTLDIAALGAYRQPNIRSDDADLNARAEQLNHLMGSSVTYQLPDGERVLDKETLITWLGTDERGMSVWDETAWNAHIADYVATLAAETDTYGKGIPFQTTGLGQVTVSGEYGYLIDTAAEAAQLTQDLTGGTAVNRAPVYAKQPDDPAAYGIGNTYIEMDLSRQHLWMYMDGNLFLETGIVSGKMTADRYTPSGIFHMYFKQEARTLRGPMQANGSYEWSAFVNYWMAFNDAIGLHDASWQAPSQFGGDTYITGGSRGCINLPYDIAQKMYGVIDTSMPIIVYYSQGNQFE